MRALEEEIKLKQKWKKHLKIQNQQQELKVSNQYMLSLITNKTLRKSAITIAGKGGAKRAMIDPS